MLIIHPEQSGAPSVNSDGAHMIKGSARWQRHCDRGDAERSRDQLADRARP